MGNPKFWAPVAPNPWINRFKIWLGWLCRRSDSACQKWYKSAQRGRRGKGVKYNVQLGYFFFFFTFLAKLWRTHFWEYHRILCTGWRVSMGIDFLGGSQHLSLIFFLFNPPKPQIFGPFLDLEKIPLKVLNNRDAHLQTTLNRHRSPTKVV